MISFRRYYLDKVLTETNFYGSVLDVGGKKENKRGRFRPPLGDVMSWEYLNTDESTGPDYLCSAENIPVENEKFDIVLLAEVVEHLEYPDKVLKESYRVINKTGKLVLTMPFLYPIHADPHDYQRWTPEKIKMELESIGFNVEEIAPMGSLFAVIYDLLYISLGMASKNRRGIKNRLINRLVMPVLSRMFLFLDKVYSYKNRSITTGYYVLASK